MRACKQCGNKMDQKSIFCEKCGAFVELEEAREEAKVKSVNLLSTDTEMFVTCMVMACISLLLIFFGMRGLFHNRISIDDSKQPGKIEVSSTGLDNTVNEKKGDSIFVADINCEYEGATYVLEDGEFQLIFTSYPTYEGGELRYGDHNFIFPISGEVYYDTEYTCSSDPYYDEYNFQRVDGMDLYLDSNGDVDLEWGYAILNQGNEYSYFPIVEDVFSSESVFCKSEYVRYYDALDKLEPFVLEDSPSDSIFRNINNGKLLTVTYYACDEDEDNSLFLTRDMATDSTNIQLMFEEFDLVFSTDQDLIYDKENVFYMDSNGEELPYKVKRGKKEYQILEDEVCYELKVMVTESEMKLDVLRHKGESESVICSHSFDEEYVQRRTVIQNY